MMKNYHIMLILVGLTLLIGGAHTGINAYNLLYCETCSAPRTMSFIFPGLGYFLLLIGEAIIYFFMRKKKILAWSLIVILLSSAIGLYLWHYYSSEFIGEEYQPISNHLSV